MKKLIYCATTSRLPSSTEDQMDVITNQGDAPFHPFQAFPFERYEGGPIGRERTLDICLKAVEMCDEFCLFGISKGSLLELNHAIDLGKPITLLHKKFDPKWEEQYAKLKDEYNDPLSRVS